MINKPTNEIVIHTVYSRLKAQIIGHEFPSGERLMIEHLADQLDVSTTPVREALSQLVAEGLIARTPKIGFFTKHLSEPELRNLYELNIILLKSSLKTAQNNKKTTQIVHFPKIFPIECNNLQTTNPTPHYLVQILKELFIHIAIQSGNSEIILHIQNINDKLDYIRRCECEVVDNPKKELLHFCQLYHKKNYNALSLALEAYHDERILLLSDLINTLRL